MAIDRWDPFGELLAMREAMERLWRGSFPAPPAEAGSWAPRLDLLEEPGRYRLQLALPGVRPDDVQVQVTAQLLTVSGERRQEQLAGGGRYLQQEQRAGRFSRSLALPAGSDPERASAQLADGVLTITLPKREGAPPRRLAIQAVGTAPQRSQAEPAGEKGESEWAVRMQTNYFGA